MKGFESWFRGYVDNDSLLMKLKRESEMESDRKITDGDLTFTKDALQDAFEAGFNKASSAVQKAISEEAENDGAGETTASAKRLPDLKNLLAQPFPFNGLPKAANLGNPLKVGDYNKALSEMLKKKK